MDIKLLTSLYKSIQHTPVKQVKIEGKDLKVSMTCDSEEIVEKAFESPPRALIKESESTFSPQESEPPKTPHKDICANEVGLFSRFDAKTKKQYVKLRDIVSKGDVIGVIQSLGVSHEMQSSHAGKIVAFLVEEGQPVEYGQPLIRLE